MILLNNRVAEWELRNDLLPFYLFEIAYQVVKVWSLATSQRLCRILFTLVYFQCPSSGHCYDVYRRTDQVKLDRLLWCLVSFDTGSSYWFAYLHGFSFAFEFNFIKQITASHNYLVLLRVCHLLTRCFYVSLFHCFRCSVVPKKSVLLTFFHITKNLVNILF